MSQLLDIGSSGSYRAFHVGKSNSRSYRQALNVQANGAKLLQDRKVSSHKVATPAMSRDESWTRKVGMLALDRGKQVAAGALGVALTLILQAGNLEDPFESNMLQKPASSMHSLVSMCLEYFWILKFSAATLCLFKSPPFSRSIISSWFCEGWNMLSGQLPCEFSELFSF